MTVAIAGGVLGFWVFVVWRVRVERGWVGVSDLARAVRRATSALVAWNDTYRKALEDG